MTCAPPYCPPPHCPPPSPPTAQELAELLAELRRLETRLEPFRVRQLRLLGGEGSGVSGGTPPQIGAAVGDSMCEWGGVWEIPCVNGGECGRYHV